MNKPCGWALKALRASGKVKPEAKVCWIQKGLGAGLLLSCTWPGSAYTLLHWPWKAVLVRRPFLGGARSPGPFSIPFPLLGLHLFLSEGTW